jgi:IS5 family transposase
MPVAKPRLVLADKGYDSDALRQELLIHGIRPVIPPRANRKDPPACDFKAYRDRNRIERLFNRLKQFGVRTRAARNRTRPLSTKDSYGRFDGDAAIRASAHLTAGSSAEHLR